MSERKPQAFIYTRISQDRSGAELGVTRQREVCEELAETKGFVVRGIFTDNDKSAFGGKRRPEYEAMAARFDEVDQVIVWQWDRLYRSPKELEAYIVLSDKHSVSTVTTTGESLDMSTSAGRFNARLYTVIGARESEIKAERGRLRAKQTLKQGRHAGGPRPFGWDLVPRTVEERSQKLGSRYALNEREAAAIRGAADDLLAGRSIGSILREWSNPEREDGPLLTTHGNAWVHASFRKMMARDRNAGVITNDGKEIARDLFDSPLEYYTWSAVVRLLNSRKSPSNHTNKARRLAVGIATCPCGRPVKTSGVTGRTVDPETGERPYHWTYFCKTSGVGHPSKRVSYVDDVVRLAVSDLFWQPPKFSADLSTDDEERKDEILRELRNLDHRHSGAVDEFSSGKLSPQMLSEVAQSIESRKKALDGELAALEQKSWSLQPSSDMFGVQRHIELMTDWLTWHLDDQRDFIRNRFKIEILPTPRTAPRVFDPHSVRVTVLGDPVGIEDNGDDEQIIYPGARVGPYWRYLEGPELLGERVRQFEKSLQGLRHDQRRAGLL